LIIALIVIVELITPYLREDRIEQVAKLILVIYCMIIALIHNGTDHTRSKGGKRR
jgi:hypothetical protein